MKLKDEDAKKIYDAGQAAWRVVFDPRFLAEDQELEADIRSGRAAFEASMRIALAVPSNVELNKVCEIVDRGGPLVYEIVTAFLANRIASYYEPQDRTTERLQKWFESHGHPEFCHDPQPLEQLAAIVIEEYEKRKAPQPHPPCRGCGSTGGIGRAMDKSLCPDCWNVGKR